MSFDGDVVNGMCPVSKAGLWINGGFFVFRTEVFEYMQDGEELVEQPFQRLIQRAAAHRLQIRGILELHGHVQGPAATRRPVHAGRRPLGGVENRRETSKRHSSGDSAGKEGKRSLPYTVVKTLCVNWRSLMIPSTLNMIFWLALVAIAALAVWRACVGENVLSVGWGVTSAMATVSLLLVGLALDMGYVAPFAVMQDIVAAQQALLGRPFCSTDIGPVIRAALEKSPPRFPPVECGPGYGMKSGRNATPSPSICPYRPILRS